SSQRSAATVLLLSVRMMCQYALLRLSIDIAIVANARNTCQNPADASAMASVRVLNGDSTSNNNFDQAAPTAQTAATANKIIDQQITNGMVTTEVGYYAYDSTVGRFTPTFTGSKPSTESWSAVRVT